PRHRRTNPRPRRHLGGPADGSHAGCLGTPADVRVAARNTAAGLAAILVFLHYYYRLAVSPTVPERALLTRYMRVAAGTDRAPDQYRLLIPRIGVGLSHWTGLPLSDVVIWIDGCSLIGGSLLLAWVLHRRGLAT